MIDSRRQDTALLALTTRAVAWSVQPLSSREVHQITGLSEAGDLLGRDPADVRDALRTDPTTTERIHALLSRAPQVAQLLEAWDHEGIWVVTEGSPHYPDALRTHLGDQAPVVLHGLGDPTLLASDGLGVVGSRNLTPDGDRVARDCGSWAARHSRTLVSGGAKGADRAAGLSALDEGGRSLWVIADGLHKAVRESQIRAAILGDRLAVCSPYHPDATFSAGAAMGRNKLIYALAGRTVVVAADQGTGGTWAGASEALKKGYGQVIVYRGEGEGPGNAELAALGASVIHAVSDLDAVPGEALSASPVPGPAEQEQQLTLDM